MLSHLALMSVMLGIKVGPVLPLSHSQPSESINFTLSDTSLNTAGQN